MRQTFQQTMEIFYIRVLSVPSIVKQLARAASRAWWKKKQPDLSSKWANRFPKVMRYYQMLIDRNWHEADKKVRE